VDRREVRGDERESPAGPSGPIHEGMNETASLSDLSRPLDARVPVKKGLDEYLSENGFQVSEYTAPTVRLKILGRYHDFPNTRGAAVGDPAPRPAPRGDRLRDGLGSARQRSARGSCGPAAGP
jgi:hypothetical protein